MAAMHILQCGLLPPIGCGRRLRGSHLQNKIIFRIHTQIDEDATVTYNGSVAVPYNFAFIGSKQSFTISSSASEVLTQCRNAFGPPKKNAEQLTFSNLNESSSHTVFEDTILHARPAWQAPATTTIAGFPFPQRPIML